MNCKTLLAKWHIDEESGCQYRYIYSNTERFVLHNHDYYELFLTLKGEITHVINGKHQQLQEGSLVFIRPKDVHSYICEKNRLYRYVNLALSWSTIDSLFGYLGSGFPSKELLSAKYPPSVVLSLKEREGLLKKLTECNAVNWQEKQKLKLYTRALITEVFTKYFADLSIHSESDVPPWLEAACEKMRKPENFSAGLERMIQLSGKTREHLARNMKKYYSVTTTEYSNNLRVNYAANMLINSDMPVIDLCYDCGFQTLSRFYVAFKEQYGISPRQYRQNHAMR